MGFKANWDGLGIFTSIACAIHCAVLPLVVTSFPLFGVEIIHNLVFEWFMIAVAFGVGLYALYHGFITHHRNKLPMIFFGIGMTSLVLKQLLHQWEMIFLLTAVVMIVCAHYHNFMLCRKSRCSSEHHVH